jgi:hypothetical protein
MVDIDLTDSNGDGVPDVFDRRRPISEILQQDEADGIQLQQGKTPPTITLELEIGMRPARKGEMYLDGYDGTVHLKRDSYVGMADIIVTKVVSAPSYWRVIADD